jgi:glycosyltransferase involved in cell wall biosynthesis
LTRRLLTIGHSYCVPGNRRLADALARTGEWDVTVAAPARFRGDFGWHVTSAAPDERCRVRPVCAHFSRPVHVMLYGRDLRALLHERWDVVHCWEEPYVASAAQVAAAAAPSVPVVFATFQNISKPYPPPFSWFERRVVARANGIVAFGHTVRDVLESRFAELPAVAVIPPGVDTTRFAPVRSDRIRIREQLGWPDDVAVVGFLGRFVPEKGLRLLMQVLDGLACPWRALVIGSGPLEGELRGWANKHGDRVRIETTVQHAEVPRWLNAMDVLLAPSQTTARWREQFGRMLIEAFACGVPVVASSSGEIPHVVGEAGVLVDEGDVVGWREALGRTIADAGWRGILSERGRARAIARYDWGIVARQHADFFEQVIEQQVAGRGQAA